MQINSPLEQFEIISYSILGIQFSNVTILSVLISIFFINIYTLTSKQSLFVVPSRWQFIIEECLDTVVSMVFDNVNEQRGQYFFPIVLVSFIDVLVLNLVGLIPSSFTLTSHFIYTFSLSISIFFGINLICAKLHGIKALSLFLPQNTSIYLAFLLVPIEVVSYVFKPISLATRLFANMMGGHTLLKVIAGFGYSLMSYTGLFVNLYILPYAILIPLFGLELGVSIIQSLVFCILTCIYIGDAIDLH